MTDLLPSAADALDGERQLEELGGGVGLVHPAHLISPPAATSLQTDNAGITKNISLVTWLQSVIPEERRTLYYRTRR